MAKSGRYQIELRRWPRESELKLTAELPETKVTDGVFVAGRSLPVASAIVSINGEPHAVNIDSSGRSLSMTTRLNTGNLTLKATLVDSDGQPIGGAYYVYVERQ